MTIEEAKTLRRGETLHYTGRQQCTRTIGPRGGITESIIQCRVNGDVKTWKRDPNRIQVPIKRGLYEYGYITADNVGDVHRATDCPLNREGV
jgi:hypothetical protein